MTQMATKLKLVAKRTLICVWMAWMIIQLCAGAVLMHRLNHEDFRPLPSWVVRAQKLNPCNWI